jgi:hypothetical protein
MLPISFTSNMLFGRSTIALAAACALGVFCAGGLRVYAQTYQTYVNNPPASKYPYPVPVPQASVPPASYSTTPLQGSNVVSNPYIYAGNASTGGYPGTSPTPQPSLGKGYPYPVPVPQASVPPASYSPTPFQGSNVVANPYVYAGNASTGGYPNGSPTPQPSLGGGYPYPVKVPQASVPPQSYSTTAFQPSNVEANPYVYSGNAGASGQAVESLRNPLIPGAHDTAPLATPVRGMPPPIGSGPTPLPVTPGMGGSPLTPNSNAFPQLSNVNATTSTSTPPSNANNTVLYQTNTNGSLGAPLVIPATSALDTTTVTGVVSPYLQPPASTPGTIPAGSNGDTSGLIYPKQYTNATYNTGSAFMPPASVGTVGVNGGITGIAPSTQKWSGAQAQTTHDYGQLGANRMLTNGKQRSEYYNTDFGQRLPLTLQSAGSPAASVLTMTQDGARPTTTTSTGGPNFTAVDSTTEQTAATTPSDYTSGVTRNPNLYSPSTSNTTWNLFGNRQVFMYNQNGYNTPHNSNSTGTPVYAQQTTAYY